MTPKMTLKMTQKWRASDSPDKIACFGAVFKKSNKIAKWTLKMNHTVLFYPQKWTKKKVQKVAPRAGCITF